jgi:hypothetical protein
MTKNETLALQRALNGSGMAYAVLQEPLEEDGIYGKRTREVHRWHLDHDTSIPTVTPEPAKPWWRSRAIIGLLTVGLAWAAGKAGWLIDDAQITQILLAVLEAIGMVVAAIGTVRRKGAIDPTLVMRLPHGRDVRLPVRAERQTPRGPGRSDPRGHFSTD